VWYSCDCVFYSSSCIRKKYRLEWSMRCRGSPRISFYSVLSCASGCHARFHLLFSTSMLCAVLLPVSFSSRFIRVIAAARPIDMAKMGSRRLFLISGGLRNSCEGNELGYDKLVRHGCCSSKRFYPLILRVVAALRYSVVEQR
jgi:hypothetical protein